MSGVLNPRPCRTIVDTNGTIGLAVAGCCTKINDIDVTELLFAADFQHVQKGICTRTLSATAVSDSHHSKDIDCNSNLMGRHARGMPWRSPKSPTAIVWGFGPRLDMTMKQMRLRYLTSVVVGSVLPNLFAIPAARMNEPAGEPNLHADNSASAIARQHVRLAVPDRLLGRDADDWSTQRHDRPEPRCGNETGFARDWHSDHVVCGRWSGKVAAIADGGAAQSGRRLYEGGHACRVGRQCVDHGIGRDV